MKKAFVLFLLAGFVIGGTVGCGTPTSKPAPVDNKKTDDKKTDDKKTT